MSPAGSAADRRGGAGIAPVDDPAPASKVSEDHRLSQRAPLAAGGPFALRLLYRGKPLAGALVKAFPKDGNERRLSARTDAQGRVRFVLPEGGIWLISVVHMIDAPAASGARWESLWSSLTFEVPTR